MKINQIRSQYQYKSTKINENHSRAFLGISNRSLVSQIAPWASKRSLGLQFGPWASNSALGLSNRSQGY